MFASDQQFQNQSHKACFSSSLCNTPRGILRTRRSVQQNFISTTKLTTRFVLPGPSLPKEGGILLKSKAGTMKIVKPVSKRLRRLPPPKKMEMKTLVEKHFQPVTVFDRFWAKVKLVIMVLLPWPFMAVGFLFNRLEDIFIYIPGFAFVILDCVLLFVLLGVSLAFRLGLYLLMLPRALFISLSRQFFPHSSEGVGSRGRGARSQKPMKFDRASVKRAMRTSFAQFYAFVQNKLANREQWLPSLIWLVSRVAHFAYVALLKVQNEIQQHIERGQEKGKAGMSPSVTANFQENTVYEDTNSVNELDGANVSGDDTGNSPE